MMPVRQSHRAALALLLAACGWEAPAGAQLLGGGLGGGLPPLTRPIGDLPIGDTVDAATGTARDLVRAPLDQVRRLTARRLLTEHRDLVEADDQGRPVVRGEVLGLDVSPAAADQLRAAGYGLSPDPDLATLGIDAVVIALPRKLSAVEAIRRLRSLDPQGRYDFNHLYQESGETAFAPGAAAPGGGGDGRGLRIGLVDGAAAPSRPTLSGVPMVQQGFAPGAGRPTAHATAIASLIAGSSGAWRAPAAGATLYVADVYGSTPTGGSAQAVTLALAWLAKSRTPVINISLVGPPNLLLEAAVKSVVAQGRLLVAAVGNDGPAAAPLYPAAYPGVVSVTAVDGRRRVLPEAGRAGHVDFAAQGSDLSAAGLNGGLTRVRGTSFAAPLVAAELARRLPQAGPAEAARALTDLERQAIDLGAPGPDPVYGRGLVTTALR